MAVQTASIVCMRGDPLHLLIAVDGVDLSAAQMSFAVGLYFADQGRLWALPSTAEVGGEGVRFARLSEGPEGLPISWFEVIATKARMQALPTLGEIGDDTPLFFDFQADGLPIGDGLANVETTIVRGPFTIKGSINA